MKKVVNTAHGLFMYRIFIYIDPRQLNAYFDYIISLFVFAAVVLAVFTIRTVTTDPNAAP